MRMKEQYAGSSGYDYESLFKSRHPELIDWLQEHIPDYKLEMVYLRDGFTYMTIYEIHVVHPNDDALAHLKMSNVYDYKGPPL